MTNAIVAQGLVKHYGEVKALDGLDLEVAEGTVLGLLGPNGAGKTTCVRILSTLLKPDAGSATVAGHDVVRDAKALRRVIGLSGQNAAVDEHLTGFENLDMVGRLYHLGRERSRTRARELLEMLDLTEAGDRIVKGYSGGMRRRLDLAAALVAEPPILFLDEPTTGLDPRSRIGMWDVIAGLVRSGTTLLLTTQYLEEADRLADRLAVIDHGRLIAEGTSRELKSSVGSNTLHVRLDDASRLAEAERILRQVLGAGVHDGSDPYTLTARIDGNNRVPEALAALAATGVGVAELTLGQPSLDDVFFALTGKASEPTREEATA